MIAYKEYRLVTDIFISVLDPTVMAGSKFVGAMTIDSAGKHIPVAKTERAGEQSSDR